MRILSLVFISCSLLAACSGARLEGSYDGARDTADVAETTEDLVETSDDATSDAAPIDDGACTEACDADDVCGDGGCVVDCTPGALRCDGFDVVACTEDQHEVVVETCVEADGEQCLEGHCLTECELKAAKGGYLACDFVAADLPNNITTMDNIFAFAFANGSTRDATVTVSYPAGETATVTVPVGGVAQHALPVPRVGSQLVEPGIRRVGFRIRSDEPITALMFNPLERYDAGAVHPVTSSDASLLIPTSAFGTQYVAMTWGDNGLLSEPPFVAVVALQDDTEVTVTAGATVKLAVAPFQFLKGVPTKVRLQEMDVLNLEPPSAPGVRRDMTGTRIESSAPVAVFAGNRCARVPIEDGYCDHLETQLPPLETWGQRFVVTKFTDRGGEPDYFKVVAAADGTALTFDPPRVAPELDAGGVWEFQSEESFTIESSQPILLGQFMASPSQTVPPGPFGISPGCDHTYPGTCQGDPAFALVPPLEQWQADPIFLVPDTYRYQFINIAFAEGTAIRLDGVDVDTSGAAVIGAGQWRGLTLPMSGGAHIMRASKPIAVVVYGYDHNISYAFNAGLDFKPLWAPQ